MEIILLCSFLISYCFLKIVIFALAFMKSQENYTKQNLMRGERQKVRWGEEVWVVNGGEGGGRRREVVDNGGEGERGEG